MEPRTIGEKEDKWPKLIQAQANTWEHIENTVSRLANASASPIALETGKQLHRHMETYALLQLLEDMQK